MGFLGQIFELEGFGFQNLERLTAFVAFLAAAFGGFLVLLRNKATLRAGTFVTALAQFGRVTSKGAIMRGLVAQIERQRLMGGLYALGCAGFERGKAFILQTNTAAREPQGFGHLMDHLDFVVTHGSFGLEKAREKLVELGLRFAREHFEFAGEAVFGGVLRNDGFALVADRTG